MVTLPPSDGGASQPPESRLSRMSSVLSSLNKIPSNPQIRELPPQENPYAPRSLGKLPPIKRQASGQKIASSRLSRVN